MNGFSWEFLLEPNLLYLVLSVAAWVGVLALFMPGTGVIEFFAAVGLLLGIAGMLSAGGSTFGLLLFGAGFVLFAVAILRQFASESLAEGLTRFPLSSMTLAVIAALLQFIGGLVIALSLPGLQVWLVLVTALGSLAIYRWMLVPTVSALRPPPQTGAEALIGERAVVRTAPPEPGKPGMVFFNGELWRAEAEEPLAVGDEVVVLSWEDMLLTVRKLREDEE